MIIDCMADLHGYYPKLKGGDLLIVAGDFTAQDTHDQFIDFLDWLVMQNYTEKIVIAGNHDNHFYKCYKAGVNFFSSDGVKYLCDSGCEINGLKFWGSPWTPIFKNVNPHCRAFMDDEHELFEKFWLIPDDTDVLITHGPAFGILDGVPIEDGSLYHCGSKALYSILRYAKRPKYHIFGHIHEGYGKQEAMPAPGNVMMQSINCSHVDGKYRPVNKPIRIKI